MTGPGEDGGTWFNRKIEEHFGPGTNLKPFATQFAFEISGLLQRDPAPGHMLGSAIATRRPCAVPT